jgi:Na+-driven multidrug efflux pump
MIIGQAFNGAGDTRTPTIMNFIACWMIQIPLAYFLAITLDMKVPGVYWAIAISSAILASMSIYLFKKGKWKLKVV